VTLALYGAFVPEAVNSHGDSWWGYGAGLQWATTERWRVSLDASRFVLHDRTITPLVAGVAFAPNSSSAVRPWIEVGGGYYRFLNPYGNQAIDPVAHGSTGNPRDRFASSYTASATSDAAGFYFGAGVGLALSSRLGLDLGARAHNWTEPGMHNWDGMFSLRSGLSLKLW
jgi:opacity protein-like surface antigen